MQLKDMRSTLEDLRPKRDDQPQMNVGSSPRQMVQVVLDARDIGTIASRYREEGHRDGYREGAEETRRWQESVRADAVRRAETLGVLAGLQLGIDALSAHIDRAAAEQLEVDGSWQLLLASMQHAFVELAREGLHGERADVVADLCEQMEVRA